MFSARSNIVVRTLGGLLLAGLAGCTSYPLLGIYPNKNIPSDPNSAAVAGTVFPANKTFSDNLIQARTFTQGTSVATVRYRTGDLRRIPIGIDFNNDGKVDPVVGYGGDQAVIQILLSKGGPGDVSYTSLTLDSKRDMLNLSDVAVGDVDGDGYLDIVAGAGDAVWYFHHPSNGDTTDLRNWGNLTDDSTNPLRERIDASYQSLTSEELRAQITQAVGPTIDLTNYVVAVSQAFTNVEIADFNNDGSEDIAATRTFRIELTPLPGLTLEPITLFNGDAIVLVNPGRARNGLGWSQVSIGRHEREWRLDRDGASSLLVYDLDGDGYLDVISAAREDNNAQIAWFANPGNPLSTDNPWTQYRVGSIRDAWAIDLADVTGDGRPDVLATGSDQQQLMLFIQPATGPRREYDWDGYAIATFESYKPRDVKALDLDHDGRVELVVGGDTGQMRYFTPQSDFTLPWVAHSILDYNPPGDIGLIGFGDLDGDGDLDLITVLADESDANNSRITWIRNDLAPSASSAGIAQVAEEP